MWHVREASLRSANIVTASLAGSLSQQIENTLRTADTVVARIIEHEHSAWTGPSTADATFLPLRILGVNAARLTCANALVRSDGRSLRPNLLIVHDFVYPAGRSVSFASALLFFISPQAFQHRGSHLINLCEIVRQAV
jgi:hypothetical protein